MSQKSKTGLIAALALAACVIVGIASYGAGVRKASAEYDEERSLNVALNRSELETLSLIEGPIYVTGHQSPDSDTVCSAIAYARLLQAVGYDAQPVVLGKVNKETAYILESAGVDVPPLLEDASACNMVLVDHSEYAHSAEGLADANVISIIDHHGVGSVTTGNQLIYDARPIGSTATIVWMRYRNYGVDLDPQTAKLLYGAILSDTSNLRSASTTTADREAYARLGELAGIEDPQAYYKELYKASVSYEGMSDDEIFESDLKKYETDGKSFAIACVNVYDEEEAVAMAERMKAVLPAQRKSLDVDVAFAQISIFHDDISVTYLVPSDEVANEVILEAFGDEAQFDGTSYILNPGVSRKQVIVPAFTEILSSYPSE